MTRTLIAKLDKSTTTFDLVDLEDCATNLIREYCKARGYNPAKMIAEEKAFIAARFIPNWETYRMARRVGQTYCLTRSIRAAVWTRIQARTRLTDALLDG